MSTNPSETTPAQTPDPFAAFKQQLPGLGQKLLGKRYGQLQKLAGYVVSEQTLNQLTHQLFDRSIAVADQLHQLSRNKTSPQGLLSAAQAEARARKALQLNRLMAAVEGGLTGATGVPGAPGAMVSGACVLTFNAALRADWLPAASTANT